MRKAKTYDLKGVGDNANGHELLAVVTAIHHQGVGKTLDDWALSLPKALDGVSASRVGDVDGRADLNVITVNMRVYVSLLVFLYQGP